MDTHLKQKQDKPTYLLGLVLLLSVRILVRVFVGKFNFNG